MSVKTAIVTGGSRGIGRAICLALAEQGANIVVNYIGDASLAEETIKLCEAKGVKVIAVEGDVSSSAAVENLVATTIKEFGSVDILVNNAGITKDNLIMRMSEEDFDKVIDINLKGAFLCMKAVARPMMKQRNGKIINISSVVGVAGNAGQVNYAASKAGLIGMTKTMAKELASRGVKVNAVAPGFIKTEMTDKLPEAVLNQALQTVPLGTLGTVEDVAKVVAFLASDSADYITGQVINIDGGMIM